MPAKPKAIVKVEAPEPELQLLREVESAMGEMEERLDRAARDLLGKDRDLWQVPLIHGLALQPGPDGRLRFQPFGHLQETAEQFLEGWRVPVLSWTFNEAGDRIEFRAEVPGLKRDDLQVEVDAERLRIQGAAKHARYKAECAPGWRLDPASAEARCEDGILHVWARVAEPAKGKGRKVAVQ